MSNCSLPVPIPVAGRDSCRDSRQDSRPEGGSLRSERSTGKGRRRRAAAEQRRAEQESWGQCEEDESHLLAHPPANSRRRARRAARRQAARSEADEDFTPFGSYDEDILSLDTALAISLSLSESNLMQHASMPSGLEMTYETLVLLENVKCTASEATVNSMHSFRLEANRGGSKHALSDDTDELCTICQTEYEHGDNVMRLPCLHSFHHGCAVEWLLNHSKHCPICKHDVTE